MQGSIGKLDIIKVKKKTSVCETQKKRQTVDWKNKITNYLTEGSSRKYRAL